jgi:hypothetical protein
VLGIKLGFAGDWRGKDAAFATFATAQQHRPRLRTLVLWLSRPNRQHYFTGWFALMKLARIPHAAGQAITGLLQRRVSVPPAAISST